MDLIYLMNFSMTHFSAVPPKRAMTARSFPSCVPKSWKKTATTFKKEHINAELKDGYLTITAESSSSAENKDERGTVIHKERYTSSCKRSFFVGEQIRQEDIKAGFENGILKLQVPKDSPKVEDTPKYIDIL